MRLTNPLGLLNNDPTQPVRVEEVANGLECNCYCAMCGGQFVAVQNANTPHFRHHNCDDCGGSFETAVHLMAKRVLVESKTLMLPYLKVRPEKRLWKVGSSVTQEILVVRRQRFQFDRVEDELWMDGRTPDIVMWKKDRKLLVEIVVTHAISEDKLKWIRENDYPTIRVDMSWVNYDISREMIRIAFYDGRMVNCTPRLNIMSWVHHPRRAKAQEEVNQRYLATLLPIGNRKTMACSLVGAAEPDAAPDSARTQAFRDV
jgi:hypothetical protein